MFGYVKVFKPELKMKDFSKYKAYYCGLCRTLKERHGRFGQMTLTYDMTFLIILLTSLYEERTKHELHRCIVHPVKKHDMLINEITEYVSDMNIVLTYYNFRDDWEDEKSVAGFLGAEFIKSDYKRINNKYKRQCKVIKSSLVKLSTYESAKEYSIDLVAGTFGEIMSELFVYRKDRWEDDLRKMGFYLGKYIYIMDAYEDLEKDLEKGSYNPLSALYKKCKPEDYEATCKTMLNMMLAECTNTFERLPLVNDIDILRNILYEGVWTKYDTIQTENKESKENNKTKKCKRNHEK
ncbi:DUF5685 family protein [Anaeromicropila herbilytica]|uniref:Uncharacterized protein n=1 Tax=Anaeromicropila herbilytica TaxID=2785025 RepID=A0A7R7ID61_9FIRM|nr:DUF5685 family protein [Anaeromicropila herbilytica]BCN30694.1 hypothetical protein bsdtb5_19890 [Anaeromicropila herbilytica]